MNNYFISFLTSLKPYNISLIESIIQGYILIESLSTDDANKHSNSNHISNASCVNYEQSPNEYFPPSPFNDIAKRAQMGYRQTVLPDAGRTSLEKDNMKNQETSNYSANYGSKV